MRTITLLIICTLFTQFAIAQKVDLKKLGLVSYLKSLKIESECLASKETKEWKKDSFGIKIYSKLRYKVDLFISQLIADMNKEGSITPYKRLNFYLSIDQKSPPQLRPEIQNLFNEINDLYNEYKGNQECYEYADDNIRSTSVSLNMVEGNVYVNHIIELTRVLEGLKLKNMMK